jgi:hypothetical protein
MTERLNVDLNIDGPDDFYQELMTLYRDLDNPRCRLVSARLILLLANHVGDREVLSEAMRIAREGVAP